MSDVLHHSRPTLTEQGAIGRRMRFLADINAKAQAIKPKPVVIQCEPIPQVARVIWKSPDDLAFGPVVFHAPSDLRPRIKDVAEIVA